MFPRASIDPEMEHTKGPGTSCSEETMPSRFSMLVQDRTFKEGYLGVWPRAGIDTPEEGTHQRAQDVKKMNGHHVFNFFLSGVFNFLGFPHGQLYEQWQPAGLQAKGRQKWARIHPTLSKCNIVWFVAHDP